MTILNQPSDGLYTVLIVLVRTVIRFGPRDEDQLFAACGKGLPDLDPSHLSRTFNRWTELGLFATSDEGIVIAEPWKSQLGAKADEAEVRLPRVLRTIALAPENNQRFWEAEGGRSADFSRGVAWMLAQDVYTLPQGTREMDQRLSRQLNEAKGVSIIQNDTRWVGLRAWMPYLGFAREGARWDVDPTAAVRDALPAIFGSTKMLLATEFLERAAKELPVLDGGKYRKMVEDVLNDATWPKPPAGRLSTSLSRALLRLEREGRVKLEQRSDTGEGLSLTRRQNQLWRDFSHISLLKKAS